MQRHAFRVRQLARNRNGSVLSPPTKVELARFGSPASSTDSKRSRISSNNIRISSRARCSPRHWCAPAPKVLASLRAPAPVVGETLPDFAPEGSLALKPWFGKARDLKLPPELEVALREP